MGVSKGEFFKRAKSLADWFVENQVTRAHYADRGRFSNGAIVGKKEYRLDYSTNWTSGMTCISLLMMYQRTKEERYLKSAKLAGENIKALQIFDERNKAAFGMIREVTPQSPECHPRDALSAAWALLHLYLNTKDKEYLFRVNLFANWFSKYAMKNNYPAWTAYAEKNKPCYWQLGSFHGGSPLFFFDLYELTKNKKWLSIGLRICDRWKKLFLKEDGSIRIEIDVKTGKDMTGVGEDRNHLGWQEMHKYNDDFTAQAQMRAYKLTGEKKYLEVAKKYLDWVLSIQTPKGYFGETPVNSAAATLILELKDFYDITKEKKYKDAMLRSVPHFLSLQELKSKDKRFLGGFYCVDGDAGDYEHNKREVLGLRTSCYALATLLRLEQKIKYAGYTV